VTNYIFCQKLVF